MGVKINFSQSYLWLNSWVLANIIQLGTQEFCRDFIGFEIDPGRRLFDQMAMAARSTVANIAEGTARRNTSVETEMRLIDVARASNDELFGDLFNYILSHGGYVWKIGDPDRDAVWKIHLDDPHYGPSLHHDAAVHILTQKAKYDPWILHPDGRVRANALLVMCMKLNQMTQSMMDVQLDDFKQNGGFTENMTAERIQARLDGTNDAPVCPKCGAKMLRRYIKRGTNSGDWFWGCPRYPKCDGLRDKNSTPKPH